MTRIFRLHPLELRRQNGPEYFRPYFQNPPKPEKNSLKNQQTKLFRGGPFVIPKTVSVPSSVHFALVMFAGWGMRSSLFRKSIFPDENVLFVNTSLTQICVCLCEGRNVPFLSLFVWRFFCLPVDRLFIFVYGVYYR